MKTVTVFGFNFVTGVLMGAISFLLCCFVCVHNMEMRWCGVMVVLAVLDGESFFFAVGRTIHTMPVSSTTLTNVGFQFGGSV